MARKLGIDANAVAAAVVASLLAEDTVSICLESMDIIGITEHILDAADVEYQPRARKLILTLDLAEPAEAELMQSQGDLVEIAVAPPGQTLADLSDPA